MSSVPLVSIIIVSWNGRELVKRCLASCVTRLMTPVELIVVDNHSTDGTPEMVAEHFPQVRLIRNPVNRGFSAANNQGAATASGEILFFINSDTEFQSDPLPELTDRLVHSGTTGAVAPRLRNADGTIQESVRKFPRWRDQVITLLKLRHLLRRTRIMSAYRDAVSSGAVEATPVDEVMGAAIMMRRTMWAEVGGWDEGYWIWFEDVDLCRRLHDRGYNVLYIPTVSMLHLGGSSFGQVLSLKKQFWFMRSLWRYARKYWSPLAASSLLVIFPISYVLTVAQTLIKPR